MVNNVLTTGWSMMGKASFWTLGTVLAAVSGTAAAQDLDSQLMGAEPPADRCEYTYSGREICFAADGSVYYADDVVSSPAQPASQDWTSGPTVETYRDPSQTYQVPAQPEVITSSRTIAGGEVISSSTALTYADGTPIEAPAANPVETYATPSYGEYDVTYGTPATTGSSTYRYGSEIAASGGAPVELRPGTGSRGSTAQDWGDTSAYPYNQPYSPPAPGTAVTAAPLPPVSDPGAGISAPVAPYAGTVTTMTTSTATPVSPPRYLDWPKDELRHRQPAYAKSIRRLMEDASDTVDTFLAKPGFEPLWRNARSARAIIIAPRIYHGGFVIGGSGGNAVMIARTPNGEWSEPAFYTIGSASIGLQAGGEVSETIMLVMTDRGMQQLLSSSVKLGGDVGIAAGPYGAGAAAQTVDILSFSRSQGLYAGVSLEGAVVKTRDKWNDLYFGQDVGTTDILIRNAVYNPNSAPLQVAVNKLVTRQLPAPAVVEYRE